MSWLSGILPRGAVAATVLSVIVPAAPAVAQGAFNGMWSVLIVTEQGPCDRAYRYPVRLADGRVLYAGQADFNVSGHVARNGIVRVTVSRGRQQASGSGRLVGRGGGGTWRGVGSAGACSGTWTAEKRG